MRRIVAAICIAMMCVITAPSYAWANEEVGEAVAPLNQGQRAPFSGTLFSTRAAARLLADAEFNLAECELEIDRRLQLQTAQFQLQIDRRDADIVMWQTKYNDLLTIRNDQVSYLEDRVAKLAKPDHRELIFIGGVASGIAVVLLTALAVNGMNSQP